jgi:putative copper export protein
MEIAPHVLHLAIRWLHVAAMATAFGGAIAVFALATRPNAGTRAAVLSVALRFEWLFWGAAGVLAMTGIGNLAAFGAGLSGPATPWGATLAVKLWSVLALVILSLPRTLAVLRMGTSPDPIAPALVISLRNLYGATACAFAVILALAIWLAHG